jgi:D-alanyl-D-alanine carboxypeptidase (penicillin-binding protein 5/6)
LLFFVLCLTLFFQTRAEAAENVDISAKAAILIDESSGRVVFARNERQRLPQASLTKIMTALLVIEHGDLDEKVEISEYAAETGESSIWLEKGEVLSRNELLYALMLNSANDAAVALAESVAGSEELFVSQMNRRVRTLHLGDTHFANPHGLDAEGHYSSAYDLASLAREGLKNPLFRKVVTTKQMDIPWSDHPWNRSLGNRNQLITRYQGARGVKTGYTNKAGSCLVGAAQRGELKLISVVLNSCDIYSDTEKLLDYGFDNCETVVLAEKNGVKRVQVKKGNSEFVPVRLEREATVAVLPGEKEKLSFQCELNENIEAPVKKGTVLGVGRVLLNGKEIDRIDYLAQEDVQKKPPLWIAVFNWIKSLFS